MSAMPEPDRSRLLVFRDGIALIPGWGWDSTHTSILEYPVRADVNMSIPVIPQGGRIIPGLYLTFPSRWVLALAAPFDGLSPVFGTDQVLAPTMYEGEANTVFRASTVRTLELVTTLNALDRVVRFVAEQPPLRHGERATTGAAEGASALPSDEEEATVERAAELLRVRGANTVKALIKAGKIAASRTGERGGYRIPLAAIGVYMGTSDFAALQAEERALDEADAYGVPDEDLDEAIAQIREERRAAS